MKTGKWLNHKAWADLSFFVKREMGFTLIFWLIVFIIAVSLKLFDLVNS